MNGMEVIRGLAIQLSELPAEGQQDVEILRTGTFQESKYGSFSITKKMLAEMVDNFKKGVRGIELMIDYGHNTEGEAAGWIKGLRLDEGDRSGKSYSNSNPARLVGTVEWTPGGRTKLAEKAYAYLSADFSSKYRDNEKGDLHGCVLMGAALTNRPVIKGMQPVVQLSEEKQGDKMSKFKLSEVSTAEMEKLTQCMEQYGVKTLDELMAKVAHKPGEEVAAVQTQLSEEKAKRTSIETELNTMKEEKKKKEREDKFNVLLSEGKACPAQKDAYMADDMVKFAENAIKGGVKTDEKGTQAGGNEAAAADTDEKVLQLAEKKVEASKGKLSIRDAILEVRKEQNETKQK